MEEREKYKGKQIVIKTEESLFSAGVIEEAASGKPELYIDGKHIITVRDPPGIYRAAGLMYAPQHSLKDLAKVLIDSEEAVSNGR